MAAQDEHWIGTCRCGWRETAETFEHLLKLARAHEAEEPGPPPGGTWS